MPCRSDYMEPNEREIESKRVCELILYVIETAKIPVTAEVLERITHGANEYYGNVKMLDADTDLLCQILRMLPEETIDNIVYNGRSAKARKLADWWEHHQKADAEREAKEKHRIKTAELKEQALSKLSEEEVKALGFQDWWDNRK